MKNELLSLYEENSSPVQDKDIFSRIPTREHNIEKLSSGRAFDIILFGGGLTNALVAHEAAVRGFSVLLLDSKRIGVNALPWDFRIFENLVDAPLNVLRAKRLLAKLEKNVAPHLITPADIKIDSPWCSQQHWVQKLTSLYNVDERLLINEYVLAARQEGAVVLDRIEFDHIEAESKSGCYIVQFRDTDSEVSIRARGGGLMVDPTHERLPATALGGKVASIPNAQVSAIYRRFRVVPHGARAGKSYGCFECPDGAKVVIIQRSPEIYEGALLFKKERLPELAVDAVFASACQEMGLCVDAMLFSRNLIDRCVPTYAVVQTKGVFYCDHRAPWDAFRSASQVVQAMLSYRTSGERKMRFFSRPLSGVHMSGEVVLFRAQARSAGIREKTIEACISRWQGRVRHIAEFPNGLYEFVPGVLRGEIDMAVSADQARDIEAVIENALGLSLTEFDYEDQVKLRERIALVITSRNETYEHSL
jgi:hypothetical protein